MLTVVILFISISLALSFLGELTGTFSEHHKKTDYIETVWNALLLLAWAYVIRRLT